MKTIRLQPDNIELATKLVALFKKESVLSDAVLNFISKDNNYLIGVFDNDQPVGILIAYMLDRPDTSQPMLYMHDITVLKSYRRQGAASSMINFMKNAGQFKKIVSKLF